MVYGVPVRARTPDKKFGVHDGSSTYGVKEASTLCTAGKPGNYTYSDASEHSLGERADYFLDFDTTLKSTHIWGLGAHPNSG